MVCSRPRRRSEQSNPHRREVTQWLLMEVNMDDYVHKEDAAGLRRALDALGGVPIIALVDEIARLDHGYAAWTITEISKELRLMSGAEVNHQDHQYIREALLKNGWTAPKHPTRFKNKVGRWWWPPGSDMPPPTGNSSKQEEVLQDKQCSPRLFGAR